MDDIIERLRNEKNEIEKEYFDLGREDGRNWCEDANYERIQYVRNWNGECIPKDEQIVGFINETIREDDLMDYNDDHYSSYPFNNFAGQYFDGFIEAVEDFWCTIEPKLS